MIFCLKIYFRERRKTADPTLRKTATRTSMMLTSLETARMMMIRTYMIQRRLSMMKTSRHNKFRFHSNLKFAHFILIKVIFVCMTTF